MHVQCSLYTDLRKELQDGSDKWTMRGWGWGRRRGDMEVHCAANSWGRWLFEDGVWSRKETIGEFTSVNRLVLNQCKGRNWPHFEVCSVCGWSQADIQWCRHQTTSKTYSWFVSLWRICTVDNCMQKEKVCWKPNLLFVKCFPDLLGFTDTLLVLVEVSGFQSVVKIRFEWQSPQQE